MTAMKKIILFALCFVLSLKIFPQTVLLQTDRERDTIPETFGPNLKYFSHLVLAYGVVFGETHKELPVKIGPSQEFRAGVRMKSKVSPVYSYGYDLVYHAVSYVISQDAEKKIPDTIMHKSQKYNFFSFALGVYNRFNLDPHRGNY